MIDLALEKKPTECGYVHSGYGDKICGYDRFITPITMVYGTQITIVTGAYKPTNITGGPHIVVMIWMSQKYGNGRSDGET